MWRSNLAESFCQGQTRQLKPVCATMTKKKKRFMPQTVQRFLVETHLTERHLVKQYKNRLFYLMMASQMEENQP